MSTNEQLVLRAEQAAQQTAKDKADIQELVTKLEEVQAPSIAASKEDIRQAIVEKGQEVDATVPFSEYGNRIRAISVGENLPVSSPTVADNIVTIPAGKIAENTEIVVGTAKSAKTYTPSTKNQTIAAGTYLTGEQTIKGDADLVAGNIKVGVNIFNTAGTFTSDANATSEDIAEGKSAYVNGIKITGTLEIGDGINTSDATAIAGDILVGKTAYVNGQKVTGTMPDYGDLEREFDNTRSNFYLPGANGYFKSLMITVTPKQLSITPNKDTQVFRVEDEAEFNAFYTEVTINPIPENYITTDDATATSNDIASGKTAYVNGEKITGTATGSGGESDTDKPIALLHFDGNLEIEGTLVGSFATGYSYSDMDMEEYEYTPTFTESGVFGGSCLYIPPPTQEELDNYMMSNKCIRIPISSDFTNNDFTIDFWYKPVSGYGLTWSWSASHIYSLLFDITSSKITYIIHDGLNRISALDVNNTSMPDTWYHVALVREGYTHKVYLNGVFSGSYECDMKIQKPSSYLQIGSTSSLQAGHIDELRITPKALWTADFTPPSSQYTEYDRPINTLLYLPFIDSIDTSPLQAVNSDHITLVDRGGVTGCSFSSGAYLYNNIFQLSWKYTASFWVYFDSEDAMGIVGLGRHGNVCGGLNVYKTAEGYINIGIRDASGITNSVAAVNYEGWNHVCVLCRAGVNYTGYIKLYVNGVDCGEAVPHHNYNNPAITVGGKDLNSMVGADFVGVIRKLKIVDTILSEEQILQEYNAGV